MTKETMQNQAEDYSHLFDDGLGGFESLSADVVAFPFIRILQSLSPQCKRTDPNHIPGAEEGMFLNNINNRVIEPPVDVVVGRFDRYFIEWKPNRGGFVQAHAPEIVAQMEATGELHRNEKNKLISRTGNEFVDTYTYYIVFPYYIEDGICLLCLSSTQLKEARRWNRLLTSTFIPGTGRKALPYFMKWTLTTVPMSNDQGSWAGLHVEFAGFVGKETLQLVTEERKALPTPEQRLDFTALEAGDASEAIDVTPGGAAF